MSVTIKTFYVHAKQSIHQVIKCIVMDQILNFPVYVAFLYRESIDAENLREALSQVLNDFPLFAGRMAMIEGKCCIDCNNQGVTFSIAHHDCEIEGDQEGGTPS